MDKKYLLISMEDERAKHIAGVLGNKTSKKIIDYLAEQKNASEKDLADALKLPINTIEYNLKKLLKAEIIEKSSTWFWSKKGKKIPTYKLSNKSIVISPKNSNISKLKSILPAVLITGLGTILIKIQDTSRIVYSSIQEDAVLKAVPVAEDFTTGALPEFIENTNTILSPMAFPIWAWFLTGALLAITIFTILNWRKL